jgi:hypothetical protein
MADERDMRCEPSDKIDDVERERLKRQKFIHHLREREAHKPRFHVSENELREKRMRERETAERECTEKDEREAEAVRVWNWLQQKQLGDGEPVRATGVATRAAEPPLTEVFDYKWVERHVAARLREERNYFEQELANLNSALIDHTKATNAAMDAIVNMVDSVFSKAAEKANNQLAGALQRVTELMNANQHQIMRAINNRIGDSKPVDEAQSTRRGVH